MVKTTLEEPLFYKADDERRAVALSAACQFHRAWKLEELLFPVKVGAAIDDPSLTQVLVLPEPRKIVRQGPQVFDVVGKIVHSHLATFRQPSYSSE